MAKCDECALKNIHNGGCPIFKADMTGKDGCPYHATQLNICEICGNLILGKGLLEEDGKWHLLCADCCTASSCTTCINQYCAFQQDQSCQEPPFIMVQRRQGNMMIQTQEMNPKRIAATCRMNCPCFNEEGLDSGSFCGRQNECGCAKYKTNWRN